jgi:hypothetical protein
MEYPITVTNSSLKITDNKELTKYLYSFSLGDGCLYYPTKKGRANKNVTAVFSCGQLKIHEDYILWRADILSNITSVHIQEKKNMLCTETNRHPKFTEMRQRMYPNDYKIVEPHYLKLFDAESLAILYQDDGSLSHKGENQFSLVISTESFSYGDNILLQRMIKDKFDILFSVLGYRNKLGNLLYRLQLQKKELQHRFLDVVEPFIKESFRYKLDMTKTESPSEIEGGDIV